MLQIREERYLKNSIQQKILRFPIENFSSIKKNYSLKKHRFLDIYKTKPTKHNENFDPNLPVFSLLKFYFKVASCVPGEFLKLNSFVDISREKVFSSFCSLI